LSKSAGEESGMSLAFASSGRMGIVR